MERARPVSRPGGPSRMVVAGRDEPRPGAQPPNMSFITFEVTSQAWLRQGRPKLASNVRSSEK